MIDLKFQKDSHNPNDILLEVSLSPNVSSRITTIRWILTLFGATCVALGVIFAVLGAQPVLGFMGVEIILLGAAYRFSIRNTRMAEQLTLSSRHLIFRRIDRNGNISITNFEPHWLKVELFKVKGFSKHVIIASKGRARKVGAFLDPKEQLKLSNTLEQALTTLRRIPEILSHS